MTELSKHIEMLLLDNDCVIVPGLGGFMAHSIVAEYDEERCAFYPPIRTVGFNPQLQLNDSLIAQSYVEYYDISYPEAIRKISSEVEEIRQTLNIEGKYYFHGIGVLTMLSDGRYDFEPCLSGILTPSLYALSSFNIEKVNAGRSLDMVAQVNLPVSSDDETILADDCTSADNPPKVTLRIDTVRKVLIAASLLLLFVFSSIPVGVGSNGVQMCSVVDTNVLNKVFDARDFDTLNHTANIEQQEMAQIAKCDSVDTEGGVEENVIQHGYTIVLASKVSKSGAERYVSNLIKKGYSEASIYERAGMRKVVLGRYDSESAAANALRQLQSDSDSFADAWISEM